MTPNPVRWFEIYVQDMDRAKAFCEAVLGTRFERHLGCAGQGAGRALRRQQHAGLLCVRGRGD